MSDIHKIYSNTIGISFFWMNDLSMKSLPKVQLVFKDIGFLLTVPELKTFFSHCMATYQSQCCHQCADVNCKSLLLKTPTNNIDLAVSLTELEDIKELIQKTIFKAELQHWVQNLSPN